MMSLSFGISRLTRLNNTRSIQICSRYLSHVTTHHSIKKRADDPRWKDIEIERDEDFADVVVVGGGPAGLSAAIKIKQLSNEQDKDLRVVLLEKGSYIGAHTLSGACIEPAALNELIPDWKEKGAPLLTEVNDDKFFYLTEKSAFRIPIPPKFPLSNHGNYIVRLGNVVKWLGEQAEEIGVEVYPGIAASELVYSEDKSKIIGVNTHDSGIAKDGSPKESFTPGMTFKSKQVVLGEGCRGHLSKELMSTFNLNENSEHQTYGIGIKELWEIEEKNWQPGLVEHGIGYPLTNDIYGGYFIYHINEGSPLVALGLVIGLDYTNPYLNPYKELQRLKHHPHFLKLLTGGKRIGYGARALNEGGYQAIPKLTVPGALMVGCSAGFLNVPKIKGVHNAIRSGRIAGEEIFKKLKTQEGDEPIEVEEYQTTLKESPVYKELHASRNVHPSFHSLGLGMLGAVGYAGTVGWLFNGKEPWTFKPKKTDNEYTQPAANAKKIDYPKPDGVISFDLTTSVALTGTIHDNDQPAHLTLRDDSVPMQINHPVYDGPEARFCPAGVYEYVEADGKIGLQINAQNCIHCKTCDIKDCRQNINWVTPQGGEGPAYSGM